jgi:hypothetical protein
MVDKTKIQYIKSSVNDNYIIVLKIVFMAEYLYNIESYGRIYVYKIWTLKCENSVGLLIWEYL